MTYEKDNNDIKVVIVGFVKFKGDNRIEEFYNGKKHNISRVGRKVVQEIIDEHGKVLDEEYCWNMTHHGFKTKKSPVFYRFDIKRYYGDVLIKHQNKVFIKQSIFEWKLLSQQTKTFIIPGGNPSAPKTSLVSRHIIL